VVITYIVIPPEGDSFLFSAAFAARGKTTGWKKIPEGSKLLPIVLRDTYSQVGYRSQLIFEAFQRGELDPEQWTWRFLFNEWLDYCRASRSERVQKTKTLKTPTGEHEVRRKRVEQVTCPHCGQVGVGSVMSRWHFDNCKHKA